MAIRIKFEHGSWWAYFNGSGVSYFHAERLEDMCNCIAATWHVEDAWRKNNDQRR